MPLPGYHHLSPEPAPREPLPWYPPLIHSQLPSTLLPRRQHVGSPGEAALPLPASSSCSPSSSAAAILYGHGEKTRWLGTKLSLRLLQQHYQTRDKILPNVLGAGGSGQGALPLSAPMLWHSCYCISALPLTNFAAPHPGQLPLDVA